MNPAMLVQAVKSTDMMKSERRAPDLARPPEQLRSSEILKPERDPPNFLIDPAQVHSILLAMTENMQQRRVFA